MLKAALVILVLLLIWLVWSLYCNEKTYKHRMKIIDCLHGRNDGQELAALYRSTSYDDELKARERLRDWQAIYPKELREKIPEAFES